MKKKILSFVLVSILLIALLATIVACKPTTEQDNFEQPINGAIITNGENYNMVVASAKILNSAYADYGISAQAESAYSLTATITPSNATDKRLDWSVAFRNPNSTWASGKNVTDYVTVTPTFDGALTANVECKQAFGEQIVVKAVSRSSPSVFATCDVDYVARLVSDQFFMGAFKFDGSEMPYAHTSTYSAYTIMPTVEFEFEIALDDDYRTSMFEDFLFGEGRWSRSDLHYYSGYTANLFDDYQGHKIVPTTNKKGFADMFLDLSRNDPMDANMLRIDANSYALSSMAMYIDYEEENPIVITYTTTLSYNNQVVSQKTSTYYPEIDLDSLAVQISSLSLNSGSLVF